MRKLLLAALAIAASAPLLAHDFWLQPMVFSAPGPVRVPVVLFVGHGSARDRWGLDASRVVQFASIGPDGVVDRKPELSLGGPGADGFVKLERAGAYVLVFQSTQARSDLPFLRFNDYVAAEGLTAVARARARAGTLKTNGRETYSRRAKAIVQIGPVDAASTALVTRPAGLELEIVPGLHPATIKPGSGLPVQILYKNKPLPGAFIKLTDLSADAEPLVTGRTGPDGRIVLAIPKRGKWQANVVWSEPVSGQADVEFRTVFSSLTFMN